MALMVQGDKERELGMPISPLMNREHKGAMTRSQVKACPYFIDARKYLHFQPKNKRICLYHKNQIGFLMSKIC